MKKDNFLKIANVAVKIAEDKKGENIVLLEVKQLTEITNYFVIVTANSMPQINAITDEIEKTLKYDYEMEVLRRDGGSNVNWKVLDFGGVIVHIMSQDLRLLYNLEEIWKKTNHKSVIAETKLIKTKNLLEKNKEN